jgi:hypothetical protein
MQQPEYVSWSDFDVVGWWVVFGEVITMVGFAASPSDTELVLFDPVLNPIELHIHGFGMLEFGAFVGKAIGC